MFLRTLYIVFILNLSFSCTKVIDLGLEEGNPIDVIEGYVVDTLAFVRIYKSNKQFYVKDEPVVIKGVDIEIQVDDKDVYKLVYNSNVTNVDELILGDVDIREGYYIQGIKKGKNYKLKIKTPEGREYFSEQKSFGIPVINKVEIETEDNIFSKEKNYFISLETEKAPEDFQAIRIFNKYKRKIDTQLPRWQYNGTSRTIDTPPFRIRLSNFTYTDSVSVVCSYTTSQVERYFEVLSRIEGNSAPSAVRIPENPPTNIISQNGDIVLGVFAVYNVSQKKIINFDNK